MVNLTVSVQDGTYLFVNVAPGAYQLREILPEGFVGVGETIAYVSITCGSTVTDDFANLPTTPVAVPTLSKPAAAPTSLAFSQIISTSVATLPVTAVYVNDAGDIYYATAQNVDAVSNPFLTEDALWKQPVNAPPIQLTPYSHAMIGGIAIYDGEIYFNEAGSLDRIPDDNAMHEQADVVLRFTNLSLIYGHINAALEVYTFQGEPVLLIGVGSTIDSSFDGPGHPSGIQPPWYEDFPTSRILFAKLQWLTQAHNYLVVPDGQGQVYEYARGVRNPWSMAVGTIAGQTRVYAVDNDPSFTPEKLNDIPQSSGDELNQIVFGANYGHPYFYAGREPNPEGRPIAVFQNGSVPSGVAIANGRIFVSLYNARVITGVDPSNPDRNHSWAPVLTGISAFNLFGKGDYLYIASWDGLQVVNAKQLPLVTASGTE